MARGLARHQLRKQQCAALGKELSRRAKSSCELCQQRRSLQVVELVPLGEEPEIDWALLLCEECQPLVRETIRIENPERLQFLHETIWSEILPIQVASIRIVKQLETLQTPWIQGVLDSVYIDPDVEKKI